MRKLMILATVALLAGTASAVAEDNAALLQPVSHGAVTGNAEKDTVAYDMAVPSDLWVRFSNDCIVAGSAPASHAALVAAAPSTNPHEGISSLTR
jgi:hypothetical protein